MDSSTETLNVRYRRLIEKFLLNITSLRRYTKSVEPVLKENSSERVKQGELITSIVNAISLISAGDFDEVFSEEGLSKEEFIAGIKKALEEKFGISEIHGKSLAFVGMKGKESRKAVNAYEVHMNQVRILYESTLISLVVYFELLIGSLIKERFTLHPESADIKSKTLTLGEIDKLGSLENAKKYLIENEVESIMRKGYKEWMKYLKEKLGLKLKYFDNNINNLIIEITQRRNIIVHNEGRVNSIYLSNVDDSLTTNLSIGDSLIVTEEYLEKSINLLEQVGILIALEIWRCMEKTSIDRIDFILADIGYEYLLASRWEIARYLYEFISEERNISNRNRAVCELNVWLCKKRMGDSEIVSKAKCTDYSDKSLDLQLAYYSLIEDKDSFFRLLPVALDSQVIKPESLLEWPILEEMRSCKEWESFSTERGILTVNTVVKDEAAIGLDDNQ